MVPEAAVDPGDSDADPVSQVYRSVSSKSTTRGEGSMDIIGGMILVGLLLLLVPLLPLLVVVWLVSKGQDALGPR